MFLLRMMLNAETIFIACTYMYVYMEAVRLTDVHFSVYNKRIWDNVFCSSGNGNVIPTFYVYKT